MLSNDTPITTLRDPMDLHLPEGGPRLRALLQEAIELAGKLRWQSHQAENFAEDIAVYATDALDSLARAAKQEAVGDEPAWADTVRRV